MDLVLWVLITSLGGIRIDRMLKEPSLKTETDKIGEVTYFLLLNFMDL